MLSRALEYRNGVNCFSARCLNCQGLSDQPHTSPNGASGLRRLPLSSSRDWAAESKSRISKSPPFSSSVHPSYSLRIHILRFFPVVLFQALQVVLSFSRGYKDHQSASRQSLLCSFNSRSIPDSPRLSPAFPLFNKKLISPSHLNLQFNNGSLRSRVGKPPA